MSGKGRGRRNGGGDKSVAMDPVELSSRRGNMHVGSGFCLVDIKLERLTAIGLSGG